LNKKKKKKVADRKKLALVNERVHFILHRDKSLQHANLKVTQKKIERHKVE